MYCKVTYSNRTGQVLIFSGVRGDTRRYRTLHLYEQLSLAGVDCTLSHLTDPRLLEFARLADVAIVHRVAYDSYVERIFRSLRQRNALIVLDADDFLYDPSIMRWIDSPDFQDPVRAALYRREILRHRATLEHCDAVMVSTDYLARLMEPFGKPVRVHRNAFTQEMLVLSEQAVQHRSVSTGPVVIGYASGTRTHDRDFGLIQPALRAVMQQYPQVQLWLMGAVDSTLDWGSLQNRVHVFPLVPWRELPERLAQLDINLAPLLPESPFNQAKSEIKFMEAALVRVPTIASRTDAFAHAIRHGETGLLAGSVEEWQPALERLIESPTLRAAMGAAACAEVMSRYSPLRRGQLAVQMLADLAAQVGKSDRFALPTGDEKALDPARFYFTDADEAHPSMAELARYSIRHRGLTTLLGQVWVYFRRKLAPIFPFRVKNAND